MPVGSCEYRHSLHQFEARQQEFIAAPELGAAAFVDAGNAFDKLSERKLKVGYGVGARWRSPIGPFRIDLAYGADIKQFRLHFSAGFSF